MAVIIPRWEWRTFGQHFGPAEAAFAKLTPGSTHDSDELYLLTPDGDTVKIRDDLMDIKVLREVDGNGLERWEPVMKASFPMGVADMRTLRSSLRLPPSDTLRPAYTLEETLAEVVSPDGPVRAVSVRKARVRYTVGGCMAELSEVEADGHRTRTLAIEAEDGDAVIAAVRSIGLGDYRNMSYPRGLSALLAGTPARYAVIDVGTNSVKFHLAERAATGEWTTLADRAEVTRLGEGLQESGAIATDAVDRTAAAIAGMVDEADASDAVAITAVGTAGLRIATNSEDVLAAIRTRTRIGIEVASGEDESRLAYLAAVAGLGLREGSQVVFDTGGGSSQFTFGHGTTVDERFSVDVGAVRYTDRFGLAGVVSAEVVRDARAAIAADLERVAGRPAPDALIGMGGALTNMTAVKLGLTRYDPDLVQGTRLDRAEIDRQIELYASMDAEGRRAITGLQPKRAEVILAGACIVRTVMDLLGRDALTVSDRGLRHGVLAERFGA
jgi:exopolyphosphatase/guanosine-5'-triphosphate,3'-diphosphate pyrophosphatase